MNIRSYFIFVIFSLYLLSCTNQHKQTESENQTNSNQYAEGFSVVRHDNFKEVIVYSPWEKGKVLVKYYLTKSSSTEIPADGKRIIIPLKSLAATSVTHFEFLNQLSELHTVTGVCSPRFIYNGDINRAVAAGQITDLGDAFNIDVEKTLQLHPEAVMMSGYNQNDPYAERVAQSGIPVLLNNEWMESSLLARAEWLKFVAAFYDKDLLADSIFGAIAQRYNDIKLMAQAVDTKPRVMSGSNYRGTWYMPSGQNYMGKLFADAGADYFYANDSSMGSLPLNVETVLKNFSEVDVWLNCSYNTLNELTKADARHKLFQSMQMGQVYNFNKRLLESTANDFWESAVAHPDLLLSDLISILHPELLPNYELVYTNQLK